MNDQSESYKRFVVTAVFLAVAVTVLCITILAGLCIVQPPAPEGPCLERVFRGGMTRECPHSGHTMTKSEDGWRCTCDSASLEAP